MLPTVLLTYSGLLILLDACLAQWLILFIDNYLETGRRGDVTIFTLAGVFIDMLFAWKNSVSDNFYVFTEIGVENNQC